MVSIVIQYLIGMLVVGVVFGTICTKGVDHISRNKLTWKQSLITNVQIWSLAFTFAVIWQFAHKVI